MSKGYLYDNGDELITREEALPESDSGAKEENSTFSTNIEPDSGKVTWESGTLCIK